jgi:hypothetical protein
MDFSDNGHELDYLCVDDFLRGAIESSALWTAFELGIMDHLLKTRHSDLEELLTAFKMDRQGLYLVLDLLRSNGVITGDDGEIILSSAFIKILPYVNLLKAKLDLMNLVESDFTNMFTVLIKDPQEFFSRSRIFKLFSYDKSLTKTPQNYETTKRWMNFTTALTRHEAMVCMRHHDFSAYSRLLDIGGNSGEFSLRVLKRFHSMSATVLDLPLVCDIGEEHVAHEPEAARITFLRRDALIDPIPGGFNLITFKSMLHDWPDRETEILIGRAVDSLAPGGTLLIFERAPLEFESGLVPYSMLPMLLFFRSFRKSERYVEFLKDKGLADIKIMRIDLDTPFSLISGIKKGS